ncbi:ribonuclease HII [Nitratiruptor sp. YY08-26]|uniref:ribonuclease HII n=1 Tax=unclassified Nitratiruptor TaxID=2624044 RepID=UPI0019158FA8|nr:MULTISPECIES: ribonuclease HII [unclassified Nitratiruptor]BCD61410.1 ribonuclease HII [Nitratiruptor sp. YY08-13]BCD65344.1 ribonuclease HII [Nitratiruptor sp. YY08-26]
MKICGIDEAGRGPLAGPLVIAGVVFTKRVYKLDDSKKLSAQMREKLYERIVNAAVYKIVIIDNEIIDQKGISASITQGLRDIISALEAQKYIFDGNSKFGVEKIEPVIKADQNIKEVMAASILAKVTRDRIMCEMDRLYPEYGFCKHKGYGTKEHIAAIKKYDFCPIHRKSFRPKALQPTLF